MKKSIRLCSALLVCIMLFCALPLSGAAATSFKGKTVIVFGDSLTNFGGRSYADIVETNLGIDIINKGIGGENTYNGSVRLQADILDNNPDVVIMCFCSNDQAIWREQIISCIPIDGYRRNLVNMIEKIKAVGSDIVLFTPNPVSEKYTPWGYNLHYNYDNGRVLDEFCNVLRELAIEYDLTLIDLHREYDVIGDYEDYFLADGLHQSDIGYDFYAEKVTAHLEAVYDNKNKATISVECVDENDNVIKSFTMTGASGANITIATPVISGYTPVDADINTTLADGATYKFEYKDSLAYQIEIAEAADITQYHAMAWAEITQAIESSKALLQSGAIASVRDARANALAELLTHTGNYEYVVSKNKTYTATAANRDDYKNSNSIALTNGLKSYPNGGNSAYYYAWNKPAGADKNTVEVVVDLGKTTQMNVFNTYLAASETWGINAPTFNTTVDVYVSDSKEFGNTPAAKATSADAEMVRKYATDGSGGAQVVQWTTYVMKARAEGTVKGRYVKFVITKDDGSSFIWLDEVEAAFLPTYVAPSQPEVLSDNASYTATAPNRGDGFDDDGERLTDGVKGTPDGGSNAYAGWNRNSGANKNVVDVVVDLGSVKEFNSFALYMAGNNQWQVLYPHDTAAMVNISVSDSADGQFTPVAVISEATPISDYDAGANGLWSTFTMKSQLDESVSARYVKFEIVKSDGGYNFIWLDEVEVSKTEAVAYNLPYTPEEDNTPNPNPNPDPPVENDYILGDVNDSGAIDMMDYILLKRNYFGTFDFDADQLKRGDCNRSGAIDMMDYILLKRAYFGTYILE